METVTTCEWREHCEMAISDYYLAQFMFALLPILDICVHSYPSLPGHKRQLIRCGYQEAYRRDMTELR